MGLLKQQNETEGCDAHDDATWDDRTNDATWDGTIVAWGVEVLGVKQNIVRKGPH